MTKEKTLTPSQMEELAQFERHFRCAIDAAWSPWPGEKGIALMKETIKAVTGSDALYKGGCSVCLLNLVRDLGRIYFRTKEQLAAAPAPVPEAEAPAVPAEMPADEAKPAQMPQPSTAKKSSGKSKKSAKK